MGISKILNRLKGIFRYGKNKANKQAARDNRFNPTSTTFEASSLVADASQHSFSLPERTLSPDPRTLPTALSVPTTPGTASSTARSITPMSQTTRISEDATSL
ncbi:hypothetical protein MCOR25_007723 [Pyricularia grisea]|nr:hypothetical protein MCOR25_007723 [Pyricularia grisea]